MKLGRPCGHLEIENRVSLHWPKDSTMGQRIINGDKGKITLHIGPIWECANHFDIEESASETQRDLAISSFIDEITLIYLIERVCLERAHERIRLKGGMCRPSFHHPYESQCRPGRLAMFMCGVEVHT